MELVKVSEARKYISRGVVEKKVKNDGIEKVEKLDLDETILDIYDYCDEPIKEYKPSITLENFSSVSRVELDIETTGLNPDIHEITLIGMINERGDIKIYDAINMGESNALRLFIADLNKKKPKILSTFNGFKFDLPFIIRRCELFGISHPFWVAPYPTVFRVAQRFSEPSIYKSIWLNRGESAVIDLYHQALAWDFVNRKLTKYNLKSVPIQMGLLEDEEHKVVELSYEQMLGCYENWNVEMVDPLDGERSTGRNIMIKYLKSDLILTKKLADYLLPDIYYLGDFLPFSKKMNLHKLSTIGKGGLWNKILIYEYEKRGIFDIPQPDVKCIYKGALTYSRAGLFRNVSKIDVKSLYPHIMLIYGIHSKKDYLKIELSLLAYLLESRLKLKQFSEDTNNTKAERREAKQRQGSRKIMINSLYGKQGTTGINFNDMEAACLVTAYGRAIYRKMLSVCVESGGIPITADTDGLFFTATKKGDHFTNEMALELNERLIFQMQSQMPKTDKYKIELQHEVKVAKAVYVPPLDDDYGISFRDPDYIEEDDFGNEITPYSDVAGKKKNYIIIFSDGSIKCKGIYNKRDQPKILKDFTPNLVKKYIESGESEAEKYFENVKLNILKKNIPIEDLAVTRKINNKEKNLVQLGIGKHGDTVTIWKAKDVSHVGKRGKILKKVTIMWTKNPSEIDWDYYYQKISEQYIIFKNTPKY